MTAEPARWQARLLRAHALRRLGRDAEALAEAEHVLDLERGQADALQLVMGFEGAERRLVIREHGERASAPGGAAWSGERC